MTNKSTVGRPAGKPGKPLEGFPLFTHPGGVWAKESGGKLHYSGSSRTDPDGIAALGQFSRQWHYLKDGRLQRYRQAGGRLR